MTAQISTPMQRVNHCGTSNNRRVLAAWFGTKGETMVMGIPGEHEFDESGQCKYCPLVLFSAPFDIWERAKYLVEQCTTPEDAVGSAWALQNVLHDLVALHVPGD